MADNNPSLNDQQQPKRRFHIPTVEEIERSRLETEKRLAPIETMRQINIDLSTSMLQKPVENQASSGTSAPGSTQPTTMTANRSSLSGSNNQAGAAVSKPSYNPSVLVSEVQRGNPLLACIRNVRWSYSKEILSDFVVGRFACVLYLSIKYHRLHPEYIGKRIDALGKSFRVRVLLVYVDTDDSKLPLREINRTALLGDMTLLLAWSLEEAGRYIESLKAFENRQPDIIKERVEDSHMARLANALTSVRSVNKTDVLTLSSNFGSFTGVANATEEMLNLCPGIGEQKAQRLFKAFNEPFIHDK
ncbi:hypothetical protein LPJ56_000371 [Coemansia sp. RSA 2599]|nr:hypothetical protein LPJ75_000114 [Coemansia sp. RSA 2598]KAJ1829429.1 hypothetical protein LPJ56_000371 [Coemansia sp. RSA 2599]